MVRKLRDAALADAERYGGIRLTTRGETLALDMLRRHRLIEVFLVDTLGFDWSEVHEEAERLEHAMSAKVLDRLDEFLDHPVIDPHGDPIPDANGQMTEGDYIPLSELAAGRRATIARVSDQDPEFLEFAAQHGLRPGSRIHVVERVDAAQSLQVRAGRRPAVGLSYQAAGKILVDADEA